MNTITEPPEKPGLCHTCLHWRQTISVRVGITPHLFQCRHCRGWANAVDSARRAQLRAAIADVASAWARRLTERALRGD